MILHSNLIYNAGTVHKAGTPKRLLAEWEYQRGDGVRFWHFGCGVHVSWFVVPTHGMARKDLVTAWVAAVVAADRFVDPRPFGAYWTS